MEHRVTNFEKLPEENQTTPVYGALNSNHDLEEEWADFEINIIYKSRLKCSKEILLSEFEEATSDVN